MRHAITRLSLVAALAVLPLSAALAQDATQAAAASAEASIAATAEAFEARMEAFGAEAEAIASTPGLSEDQREARIEALWLRYAPEVEAFTKAISLQSREIAAAALQDIDLEALVQDAMLEAQSEVAGQEAAVTEGQAAALAMARNGAWAQDDPEQAYTYALIARHALNEAADAMDAALSDGDEDGDKDPRQP